GSVVAPDEAGSGAAGAAAGGITDCRDGQGGHRLGSGCSERIFLDVSRQTELCLSDGLLVLIEAGHQVDSLPLPLGRKVDALPNRILVSSEALRLGMGSPDHL